jgi:hypothetical protein
MTCAEAQQGLEDRMLDMLSPGGLASLGDHLDGCVPCRRLGRRLAVMEDRLPAALADGTDSYPSAALKRRVMEAVAPAPVASRRPAWLPRLSLRWRGRKPAQPEAVPRVVILDQRRDWPAWTVAAAAIVVMFVSLSMVMTMAGSGNHLVSLSHGIITGSNPQPSQDQNQPSQDQRSRTGVATNGLKLTPVPDPAGTYARASGIAFVQPTPNDPATVAVTVNLYEMPEGLYCVVAVEPSATPLQTACMTVDQVGHAVMTYHVDRAPVTYTDIWIYPSPSSGIRAAQPALGWHGLASSSSANPVTTSPTAEPASTP